MKRFKQIILQSKDDNCDWRAFLYCCDSANNDWVLRGYGKTPGEAADCVWDRFIHQEYNWDAYGENIYET